MIRSKLLIVTLITLLAAAFSGYFLARQDGGTHAQHRGLCTETSVIARQLQLDEPTLAHIQSLDDNFIKTYSVICEQLCEKRDQLAACLPEAKADDPQVLNLIAMIHELQTEQEKMTFQHIVAIRDILPAKQKAAFIKKVRAQWTQGQEHLKTFLSGTQCTSEECGCNQEGSGRKGE